MAEEAFAFSKTALSVGGEFLGTTLKDGSGGSKILVMPDTLKSDLYKAMTKGAK